MHGKAIKFETLKNIYIYIYIFMLFTTCSNYSRYYSIIKNNNKMNNNVLYYPIDIATLN